MTTQVLWCKHFKRYAVRISEPYPARWTPSISLAIAAVYLLSSLSFSVTLFSFGLCLCPHRSITKPSPTLVFLSWSLLLALSLSPPGCLGLCLSLHFYLCLPSLLFNISCKPRLLFHSLDLEHYGIRGFQILCRENELS